MAAMLFEAIFAIDRTIVFGYERNFAGLAAICTYGVILLALTAANVLTIGAAFLAAGGLILEALFSIELLLASGEYELRAAFLAYQCLVFEHVCLFPLW